MLDPDHTWKTEDGRDKRKCPTHNTWMRHGKCEVCRLSAEARQRENEKLGGSKHQPIIIRKI
jgi:hypothetical protein